MPIISITGPRQSGKTTIAKKCFPDYDYCNLENPDTLEDAVSDPRYFLTRHKRGLIIDEVQKMPELFSYIQTISDHSGKCGEFILTGSQNFLLSEKISQSLAGRVFITNLLPLSIDELKNSKHSIEHYNELLLKGFYPRIYDKSIAPELFYPSYVQTYVERDVRQIINISDLYRFQRFLKLASGRVGQMINYSSFSNELGIDVKTVKSWFGILEASFITFFLYPYFKNYNKRVVKTPKLYFYDTGLVCSLLGIGNLNDVDYHWAKGALFENMILAEFKKIILNHSLNKQLYFWRDNNGNEVDCIIENAMKLQSCEIKSGITLSQDSFKGLEYFKKLSDKENRNSYLIYGGEKSYERKEAQVTSWQNLRSLFV